MVDLSLHAYIIIVFILFFYKICVKKVLALKFGNFGLIKKNGLWAMRIGLIFCVLKRRGVNCALLAALVKDNVIGDCWLL